MAENTIVKNNKMYPPAVLSWPSTMTAKGEVPEFRCEIPADVDGLLIVWKVPVCDAYPEGYFMSLNESEWNISMPGCLSTDMLELCRVQFRGFSDDKGTAKHNDEHDTHDRQKNELISQCPDISVDTTLLNPEATPVVITSKTQA